MIRNYVNSKSLHEDLFLKAVRLFLRRYQHQSVEAKDFWKVFQEVTGEDIGALFSGWFTKPGFPLITVQQNRLVQERFLSGWNKHESTTPWKIPVEICQLTRKSHPVMNCTEKMTINDKSTILTNHEFSMLNPELAVYYIIKYEDEDHFQKVLESSHEFSEVGRYYFLRDVEFLVRHSHYYMDRLLTAIDKFRNDRSYLVQQMVMEMEHYSRVMKEGGYPEIARFAGLNEHGFLKR
ncbi:hypothetical protein L596_001539 [Steinernema carpocapsae]|uniref:Peptidase M1 membrane alanine aminopeptidase domain-containing protein n=1 Tax=Steinernema carpocapsae TaxID=34508 RepID=A0A4U8UQI0_STECR|nr:hypothetical protein L596_001539 [Steinernema carpocapsae]